jgi:hypothetical protein
MFVNSDFSELSRLFNASQVSAETGSPFGDTETDSSLAARRGAGRLAYPLPRSSLTTDSSLWLAYDSHCG